MARILPLVSSHSTIIASLGGDPSILGVLLTVARGGLCLGRSCQTGVSSLYFCCDQVVRVMGMVAVVFVVVVAFLFVFVGCGCRRRWILLSLSPRVIVDVLELFC